MKAPNGIPQVLLNAIRNGGLIGERNKFKGYFEIVSAYTKDSNIHYIVKLFHRKDYQEFVEIITEGLDKKQFDGAK